MEEFFEYAGYPTPPDYNPADHYVTVVNDDFRDHPLSIDEWAERFFAYKADPEVAVAKKEQVVRTNSMLTASRKAYTETARTNIFYATVELTRRYFLNLFFNPGILGVRIVMYSMLAMMVGALFWNVGERDDYQSIHSKAAVLMYCVSFFIFMSVAVLPFTVIERAIVDKEVRNGYYHPAAYQMSQAISTVPGAAILAFLTTLIVVSMTDLRDPLWYFLGEQF